MSMYHIGSLLSLKRILSSQHASAGQLSQSEMKVTVYDKMGSDKKALLVTSTFDVNDSHNLPAPWPAWPSRGQGEEVGSKHGGPSWWQQGFPTPPPCQQSWNPHTPRIPGTSRTGWRIPSSGWFKSHSPCCVGCFWMGMHNLTFCKVGHVRC